MNLEIKYQSTGDNDSIEDAIIAILNIKTTDGKYVDSQTLWDALEKAWKASRTAFGVADYETKND